MELAALAQFDLAPPVASFDFKLDQEDEKAASQLLVVAGRRPPRYYFLHSSAAELVFRSLAWNDGVDDHLALAADYLITFFKSRPANDKQLAEDLANVIHNRLGLEHDPKAENYLRSRFLADDDIYTLIESVFEQLPLNSLAVCLIVLYGTDETTFERYHGLVQRKVDDGSVLRMTIERPFWDSGLFLRLVKRAYPLLLSGLRSQLVDRGLGSLIKTTEFQNILALMASLSDPDDSWWATSLDSIPKNEFDAMIQRTVASGRSIGTINFALQELKKTDKPLLEKLERKISVERYVYLIASAGTILELFMVIRDSSPSMAGELIQALNAEALDALNAQTIASGRSIGTINRGLVINR